MNNITAIIVVKDNPPHLFETLKSIDNFASEIIIGSIQISEQLKLQLQQNPKIKIIEIQEQVPYADLIKEDLKQQAQGEYILYLDPDEIFPDQVKSILEEKVSEYDFFYFPRKNIIFGKWIQHSRWWPDIQLRFFKKNSVIWPKTIHPIPHTEGKGYEFEPKEEYAILHYNYDNLDHFIEKTRRYAKSEALEYVASNRTITLQETIKKALNEFISRFFASQGYKDGMHGFTLAFLQMTYYFLLYFYYWESKGYTEHTEKELINSSHQFFKQGLHDTNHWMVEERLVKGKDLWYKFVNRLLQ